MASPARTPSHDFTQRLTTEIFSTKLIGTNSCQSHSIEEIRFFFRNVYVYNYFGICRFRTIILDLGNSRPRSSFSLSCGASVTMARWSRCNVPSDLTQSDRECAVCDVDSVGPAPVLPRRANQFPHLLCAHEFVCPSLLSVGLKSNNLSDTFKCGMCVSSSESAESALCFP